MCRICGRRPILEKRVMRNVVGSCTGEVGGSYIRGAPRGGPIATGGPVRVGYGQVETAHERTPSHLVCVEEIADIISAHLHLRPARGRTNIPGRIGVADDSAAYHARGGTGGINSRRRSISGYEVHQSRRRRPERRAKGIVVHREVLGVVPQGRHRVAVEIAHHETFSLPQSYGGVQLPTPTLAGNRSISPWSKAICSSP